jgi:hypothetical protein
MGHHAGTAELREEFRSCRMDFGFLASGAATQLSERILGTPDVSSVFTIHLYGRLFLLQLLNSCNS